MQFHAKIHLKSLAVYGHFSDSWLYQEAFRLKTHDLLNVTFIRTMFTAKEPDASMHLDNIQEPVFTAPEQYGLPPSPAQQKLSLLDMNMPRLYGTRWILCFPLQLDADQTLMYDFQCRSVYSYRHMLTFPFCFSFRGLKAGLAKTISSIPWIAGNIVSLCSTRS